MHATLDTYLFFRAAAVEDKLQEGVPETISLFQKAGIKVHVNQTWPVDVRMEGNLTNVLLLV